MQCSAQITLNYVYLSFKYWKILIIFYWKMFHFLPEKSDLILPENYLFYWKILIKNWTVYSQPKINIAKVIRALGSFTSE